MYAILKHYRILIALCCSFPLIFHKSRDITVIVTNIYDGFKCWWKILINPGFSFLNDLIDKSAQLLNIFLFLHMCMYCSLLSESVYLSTTLDNLWWTLIFTLLLFLFFTGTWWFLFFLFSSARWFILIWHSLFGKSWSGWLFRLFGRFGRWNFCLTRRYRTTLNPCLHNWFSLEELLWVHIPSLTWGIIECSPAWLFSKSQSLVAIALWSWSSRILRSLANP